MTVQEVAYVGVPNPEVDSTSTSATCVCCPTWWCPRRKERTRGIGGENVDLEQGQEGQEGCLVDNRCPGTSYLAPVPSRCRRDEADSNRWFCTPRWADGSWPRAIAKSGHQERRQIVTWRLGVAAFLLYKVATLLFFVSYVIRKFVAYSPNRLAYLTQQSWIIICVYQATSLILLICRLRAPIDTSGGPIDLESTKMPQQSRSSLQRHLTRVSVACWTCHILSWTTALAVTGGYWTVIYPRHAAGDPLVTGLTPDNLIFHAGNTVYVVVETLLVRQPSYRLGHAWLPALYGLAYVAFLAAYWAAGGKGKGGKPYVYSPIDFESAPEKALLIGLLFALVALPLVHASLWAGYRVTRRVRTGRWCGDNGPKKTEGQEHCEGRNGGFGGDKSEIVLVGEELPCMSQEAQG